MKRTAKILILAAVFSCFPPALSHADIYQYTDESGVVHFTNVNSSKKHKRVASEGPAQVASSTPKYKTRSSAMTSSRMPSAYVDMINDACNRHGVDPSLVHAVMKVESDFNPFAMSRKGAMGLMQLMPETAMTLNVKNSFNPEENIDGGVRYLRYLIDRYEGNLSLALAAYNSGETAVKKWGAIPPYKETQDYVQRILKIYNGGTTAAPNYVKRQTIYMGYGDDGSLVLTDNPTSQQTKTFKRKTGKRTL